MGFDELYRKHVDAVYGFLMFKLRDAPVAEDLLQETFLAVYQNLAKIEKTASPKAWILSVAQHKMVDYLRKNRSRVLPSSGEHSSSASAEPLSTLFLREILEQLEGVDQSVIYGLYVEDLSYKELAQILGIPEGTLKSKAHYARKKLRPWLEEVSN